MKVVLTTNFIEVSYDPTNELLIASWKPASEHITDQDFRFVNETYLKTSQEKSTSD